MNDAAGRAHVEALFAALPEVLPVEDWKKVVEAVKQIVLSDESSVDVKEKLAAAVFLKSLLFDTDKATGGPPSGEGPNLSVLIAMPESLSDPVARALQQMIELQKQLLGEQSGKETENGPSPPCLPQPVDNEPRHG